MTTRQELERQADMIEAVLHRQNIQATVTGGHVTPRSIQFTTTGATVDRVTALADAIARSLHVTRADVTRQGNAVCIVVPRGDPKPVALADMLKRIKPEKTPIPPATALLGLADDGAPLLARLPSKEVGCHMLIEGGPHTGKTSLLKTVIFSLATYNPPRSLRTVAIGRDLDSLDRLPTALKMSLHDLAALIDKRQAEGAKTPTIVVAIDDLGDLDHSDRSLIDTLATRGSAVAVYFIGATRDATDRPGQWPTLIKAKQDADAGDFVITPAQGPTISFVAAYAAPTEVDDLILQAKK